MPCLGNWVTLAGQAVLFGVGDAVQEVLSGGTLTPGVVAEAVAEISLMLVTMTSLYECYQQEGAHQDAEQMKAKIDALQKEMDAIKSQMATH
jgi:hypothetical protein